MVQQGVLPPAPTLRPLNRISPSRFVALSTCPLQEIWAGSREAALLPRSPTAKLGTIIHRLLEQAGKGLLEDDDPGIEERWSELVNEVEKEMRQSWLEKSLTPLSKTVPQYTVRKIRACKKAREIASDRWPSQQSFRTKSLSRYESWVESSDRLIGGSIDQVLETADGVVLRDFKSGQVTDSEDQSAGMEVKESYKVQLKLYASLFASKHGRWPTRLEVVPLQGPVKEVSFTHDECEELLAGAIKKLRSLNKRIYEVAIGREPIHVAYVFANPSPSACGFCSYRPSCTAYDLASSPDAADAAWPRDIRGVISEFKLLGNNKLGLTIKVNGKPHRLARVRGIDSSPERHPALRHIREGEKLGIYNLKGSRERLEFSQTASTTIYVIPSA